MNDAQPRPTSTEQDALERSLCNLASSAVAGSGGAGAEPPRCGQRPACDAAAVFRYTWPGRDEALICLAHAVKLRALADAMELHVQLIPLPWVFA